MRGDHNKLQTYPPPDHVIKLLLRLCVLFVCMLEHRLLIRAFLVDLILPERQVTVYSVSGTASKYQYIRRWPYRLHISRIKDGDIPERTDCQRRSEIIR